MKSRRLAAAVIAVLTFALGAASAWLANRPTPEAVAQPPANVEQKSAPLRPAGAAREPLVVSDVDWAARNRAEERDWSRKTGLPAAIIRKLRRRADLSDEPQSGTVDHIDARGLKSRGHILFVTAAGNGHCLDLYVFERRGDEVEEVWRAGETPDGGGFCRGAPANPEAYVRHDGKVEVKIVWADYREPAMDGETEFFTYGWDGKTYRLESRKTAANR